MDQYRDSPTASSHAQHDSGSRKSDIQTKDSILEPPVQAAIAYRGRIHEINTYPLS